MSAVDLPAGPARSFASDNFAGAHPEVIEAIRRANHGHAAAYGDDPWTKECEGRFRELFGADVTTLLTFNGTGSNVLALAALLGPADAVVCTDWAHIAVDEAGGPERILGAKLIDLDAPGAKLTPAHLEDQAHLIGDLHHAQPAVVSITQSTELGTVYSVDEIGTLCDTAHRLGMTVHVDGARIANATAALGGGAGERGVGLLGIGPYPGHPALGQGEHVGEAFQRPGDLREGTVGDVKGRGDLGHPGPEQVAFAAHPGAGVEGAQIGRDLGGGGGEATVGAARLPDRLGIALDDEACRREAEGSHPRGPPCRVERW